MKNPYYSYIQIIHGSFKMKSHSCICSGGIMKTFAVVIALAFVILCFPNYGTAQQKEKTKMKEESITMEKPKALDWMTF